MGDQKDKMSSNKSQKGHYHFTVTTPEAKDGDVHPVCKVCQHPHIGKCHICGHVLHAKSNVFSAAGCPGGTPTPRALHFELFSASRPEVFDTGWSLAKIIRRKVFVEERLGEKFPGETCEQLWAQEIMSDDTTCQHSIGYFGDMPVATARWKIVTQNDGQRLIKLDKVCVLERYRQRHVFVDLLQNCVDIATKEAATLNVSAILFCCPTDLPHLTPTLASMQFIAYPNQQFEENGRQKVPFMRPLR